jgi:hypothetical protein
MCRYYRRTDVPSRPRLAETDGFRRFPNAAQFVPATKPSTRFFLSPLRCRPSRSRRRRPVELDRGARVRSVVRRLPLPTCQRSGLNPLGYEQSNGSASCQLHAITTALRARRPRARRPRHSSNPPAASKDRPPDRPTGPTTTRRKHPTHRSRERLTNSTSRFPHSATSLPVVLGRRHGADVGGSRFRALVRALTGGLSRIGRSRRSRRRRTVRRRPPMHRVRG